MEFSLEKLIPRVSAQADVNVQPTFGNLDVDTSTSSRAVVSLTTSSTSVVVGNTFEVDVRIDTNGVRIKEFDIIIDFDTTKLSVVDAEPTELGTQIEFLDTIFEVENNGNFVDISEGRITLRASTPTQIAYEIPGRSIARIQFQSQETGTTLINTVKDASGTRLVNSQDRVIALNYNDLTISSAQSATSTTTTGNTDTVPTSTTGGNTNTTSTTGSTGGGDLPDTGVEEIINFLPFILGIGLIILGIMLSRSRKPANPYA